MKCLDSRNPGGQKAHVYMLYTSECSRLWPALSTKSSREKDWEWDIRPMELDIENLGDPWEEREKHIPGHLITTDEFNILKIVRTLFSPHCNSKVLEPLEATWPDLKGELRCQVRVTAANDLENRAQCETRGRSWPGAHKWRHCLNYIQSNKKKKPSRKARKPNHWKNSGQYPLPKKFFFK